MARQKKELFSSYEDRDNALLDKELLTNRLKHLESEIETQRTTQNDRSREIRSLEVCVSPSHFHIWYLKSLVSNVVGTVCYVCLHLQDKIKHLELELDEEKNSAEMLTERITRSRDQVYRLSSVDIADLAHKCHIIKQNYCTRVNNY